MHDDTTAELHELLSDERYDADYLMAAWHQAANEAEAHRRAGFCTHGSAVRYRPEPVYPEQVGLSPGQSRCTAGCNTVWDEGGWEYATTNPYADPIPLDPR
ncbi:hypothetical protein OG216_47575 (plasmid) [Streptomycetaceae bacterium NBC_01309]